MAQNRKFIDALDRLGERARQRNEPFKSRAYLTASNTIKNMQKTITRVADVDGQPGIGTSIRAKIDEILRDGSLRELEDVDTKMGMRMRMRNIDLNKKEKEKEFIEVHLLTQIHGIGPKKASELIDKGVTFSNLGDNLDELNDVQKKGFSYVSDFLDKIPRDEMEEHEKIIKNAVKRFRKISNMQIISEVVGSYRRGRSTSGDIDVLISVKRNHGISGGDLSNIIQNLAEYLKEQEYLVDVFSQGSKKLLGVCRISHEKSRREIPYRRIDLLFIEPPRYPFALLYFTGSANFNIAMRRHAVNKGYSLNEFGVIKSNKKDNANNDQNKNQNKIDIPFSSERDVFDFFDLNYILPTKRDGSIDELFSVMKKKEKKIGK